MRRVVLMAVILARPLAAQQPAPAVGYITTLGADTVAVEQYRQVGDRTEGDFAIVKDSVMVHHFTMSFARDGRVATVVFVSHRRGHTATDTVSATFVGDSATLFSTRLPERTKRISAPAALPMFVGVNALEEAAVARAARIAHDSVTIPVIALNASFVRARFPVFLYARDSVGIWSAQTPAILALDTNGHVIRNSARLTSVPTETVRVPPFDFDRVLASLHERVR